MWHSPTPLSDKWVVPPGSGSAFLMKYLIAQQTQTYGEFYTGLPYKVLQRNMKLLLADYDDDTLKRAIALGCITSDYPFSTAFVKEMAECLTALRKSPMQTFYQNKS